MIDTAVILAGGKSKRMGKDKALLPFAQYDSMAQYQYKKLEKIFQNVHISAKSSKFDFATSLIIDSYPQSSPMVAMVSIFEQLGTNSIFILSVDTPLVDEYIIQDIVSLYGNATNEYCDILVAESSNGIEPLCGIYSRNVLPTVKKLLGLNQHKLKILLEESNTKTIYFNNQEKFLNINNFFDYSVATTY